MRHFFYPTCLLKNRNSIEAFGKRLEEAVRALDNSEAIYETYVICGPVFDFAKKVDVIGENDSNQVTIPIPTHFFKSVLVEKKSGNGDLWSFLFHNEESQSPFSEFRVNTTTLEQITGILLWGVLIGDKMVKKKNAVKKMWS